MNQIKIKKMKININNSEKLQSALDRAQKRSQTRTIDCEDFKKISLEIESRLKELKIAKVRWKGAKFHVDLYATIFPSQYKGIPKSTQFSLERGSSDWFVVSIHRGNCDHGVCNHIIFENENEFKQYYSF